MTHHDNIVFCFIGKANLALTAQKQYLQRQLFQLNNLKESVKATEKKIRACDEEGEAVEKELIKAQQLYEKLKQVKDNYRVIFCYTKSIQ